MSLDSDILGSIPTRSFTWITRYLVLVGGGCLNYASRREKRESIFQSKLYSYNE
jgi:hypothetical protein